MMKYDYLIIGAGLYGSVFADLMTKKGKKCLVIDKKKNVAGNLHCEKKNDITVHVFGAHIFHTSSLECWNYVNSHAEFIPFVNSPLALNNGTLYNLPFNMNTFNKLFGVKTESQARKIIKKETEPYKNLDPKNLEEQSLKLVGPTIYEALIKSYSQKQWGVPATEIPAFIVKRIPLRFTFDNNYFNDTYQGIPRNGYNEMIESMLSKSDVVLGVDYFLEKEKYNSLADKIVYTGKLDEFFNYKFGDLEYRSLEFEHKLMDEENFQSNAVVNYCDSHYPFTRIIEHKHFDRFNVSKKTIITLETPKTYKKGLNLPYYPINNAENEKKANLYKKEAESSGVIFGGRLAEYKYYDMNVIIENLIKKYGN